MDRLSRLATVIVWALCLYLTFSIGLYEGDILAEKAVAQQVVSDGNPYGALEDIDGGDGFWSAPRLPGALLVLGPLAWVPDTALANGVTVLNVTAVILVMLLSLRIAGMSTLWIIVAPLLILSAPGVQAARSTNLAPIVGLAVVTTWFMATRGDLILAGIPLGVAATMRLFPLWIAIALLVGGRKRIGWAALGTFVGLNLVGLLLPAVTVDGTLQVLGQDTFYSWGANISLAAIAHPTIPARITVAILLGGLLVWLLVKRPRWETGMVAAPIALLAGPVTWSMYLTAVGPLIPRVFLPVAFLWFLPLFGIDQQLPLMLSLVVLLFRRRPPVATPAPPEEQTTILIDLTDRALEAAEREESPASLPKE